MGKFHPGGTHGEEYHSNHTFPTAILLVTLASLPQGPLLGIPCPFLKERLNYTPVVPPGTH